MSWKTYEDLEVFQKAYDLALTIHKATRNFPKEELYSLTAQLRRSSKSICANIAEGQGKSRSSANEFCRFLTMAIGSIEETKLWLKFSLDLSYIEQEDWKTYTDQCIQIAKMLSALIVALQKTANR